MPFSDLLEFQVDGLWAYKVWNTLIKRPDCAFVVNLAALPIPLVESHVDVESVPPDLEWCRVAMALPL